MTTLVYVWPPRGEQVGHAAVSIQGSAGARYISWWPDAQAKAVPGTIKGGRGMSVLMGVTGVRFTYEQDKEGEGGFEPLKVALEGLNEAKMVAWWDTFARKNWSLLNVNCAQVAADALREGEATTYTEGVGGWLTSWQATYWKPMEVYKFAKAVEAGLLRRRRSGGR